LRNVSVDTLESICGDGDFQSIEVLAEYILGILVRLVEGALGVLEVLSCETIVPLYVSEVSQRFCHDRVRFSHSTLYALYYHLDNYLLQWHLRVFGTGCHLDVCIIPRDCGIWNDHDHISHCISTNGRR
jgi:hypothetical protein